MHLKLKVLRSDLILTPMELSQGTRLQGGKYVIEKKLGQGGFGITYLANQIDLNRKVAVKEFFIYGHMLRDDGMNTVAIAAHADAGRIEQSKQRFIKEARIIASLNHENIISIFDIFKENGTAYYVMEYISGGSLSDLVNSGGRMTECDAVALIIKVGKALSHVHTHQILHLDVKPGNIMMKDSSPVLIDFGISKNYTPNGVQTSTTALGFSPGFSPIEQYVRGSLSGFTPSSDVYSLAATLYYLLSAKVPPEPQSIMNVGLPSPGGEISEETKSAIAKAMAVSRNDRTQSVDEFINQLGPRTTLPPGSKMVERHPRREIEELVVLGDLKGAYWFCVENVNRNYDAGWNRDRAATLMEQMKKKENRGQLLRYIGATLLFIASIIIMISI